jgi:hypothetical protein
MSSVSSTAASTATPYAGDLLAQDPALSTNAYTAGKGSASSTNPATGATAASSYQQEYSTLQQQDAAELIQVSLDSPSAATQNVISVLSQAAAYQSALQASTHSSQLASATSVPSLSTAENTTPTSGYDLSQLPTLASLESTTPSDPNAVPTLDSIINGTGSNVNTTA